MNMPKNARLTPQGRLLMVRRIEEHGWKVADAASAAGLSVRRTYHFGWGDIGRAASGCCAAGARRPLDTGVNRNRGIGYDVLHVCIDDASRLAYTGFDT